MLMISLATRFILELVGIALVAWLGAAAPVSGPARALLVVALPIALIVVWGLVVAPKADNSLPLRARELLGTGLLLAIAGGLALAGQPVPAAAFAAIVVVDQVLLVALGQGTAIAIHHAGPTA
jgi:hypothetical protein